MAGDATRRRFRTRQRSLHVHFRAFLPPDARPRDPEHRTPAEAHPRPADPRGPPPAAGRRLRARPARSARHRGPLRFRPVVAEAGSHVADGQCDRAGPSSSRDRLGAVAAGTDPLTPNVRGDQVRRGAADPRRQEPVDGGEIPPRCT